MMLVIIIFTTKVSLDLEREIKLREFNFKVLHGILPCNKNLKQWKVRISDHCDVCGQIQTIEHLPLTCLRLRKCRRHESNNSFGYPFFQNIYLRKSTSLENNSEAKVEYDKVETVFLIPYIGLPSVIFGRKLK